jgi:hypothetical protein
VDLEEEGRPSVHAATDLKGYNRALSDNPVDDDLVGDGLGDQLAGFLSLRTGEPLRAPALNPVPCWRGSSSTTS